MELFDIYIVLKNQSIETIIDGVLDLSDRSVTSFPRLRRILEDEVVVDVP